MGKKARGKSKTQRTIERPTGVRGSEEVIRKKAKGLFKFDIVSLSNPVVYLEKDESSVNTEYYPFGDDNLFPQYLTELKRKSSTHRAILAQKATYSAGSKITSDSDILNELIRRVNPNQSLKSLNRLLDDDYYTFGNAYMEAVPYEGGYNFYHLDSSMCRVSKDLQQVLFHPNWEKVGSNLKGIKRVPRYPNKANDGRTVIHFKDYEAGFQRYGIPDYIAAASNGAIEVDYLIQRYNRSKFENGFMPSAIIEIDGSMSDKEAEDLIDLAQSKLTGDGNNGKILFLLKEGGGQGANVTILEDNKDGSFMEYQELTRNNLVTAHRWQPALSGIVSSGKMNNTGSEIRIAYDLVMRTVVQDTTDQVFNVIKDVIGELLEIDSSSMAIQFESPISYASDIDITQIADVNELRKLIGLEERQDLEGIFINALKESNGSDRL